MQLQLKRPIAFFDLETTGVTLGLDRIIEISVLKLHPDGSKEIYTRRINPGRAIPPEITKLTGISDDDVKDQPVFEVLAKEIHQFFENCDLAGYNSNKFDVPFLVEEFYRAGVEFVVRGRKLVDVQNIFHKMEPRTLSAAYKFYCGKTLENAHSAEADITATAEILEAQLAKYEELEKGVEFLHDFTNLHKTVDLAGRMVFDPQQRAVFNFGKHKGKPVTEVFTAEPSYYDWLMKGDFASETKAAFKQIWESMRVPKEEDLTKKLNALANKFGNKG